MISKNLVKLSTKGINLNSLYQSYLQKISFMNLKKLGGGGVCDGKQLLAHIKTEGHLRFVQDEIEIIDPEIIILGLSWGSAEAKTKELILPGINKALEQCNYSIEVGKLGKIKIIELTILPREIARPQHTAFYRTS